MEKISIPVDVPDSTPLPLISEQSELEGAAVAEKSEPKSADPQQGSPILPAENHQPSSQSETAPSNGGASTSLAVEVRDTIDHRTIVDVSFANGNRQSTSTPPSTSINSLAATVLGEQSWVTRRKPTAASNGFPARVADSVASFDCATNSAISAPIVQSTLSHPDFQKSRGDKSQSNSLSGQYSPSNKEVISSINTSSNSSSQKLNHEAPEFSISHQPQLRLQKCTCPW
ncbi:OLC1v1024102C1 [Oldenlandia corymbosa var. corymbosa]|uniref:OLC1v1024102C1 n=1 Tax=Oldenlandia corymbosa var. corymbosa TaxID=529605 RepID=A0AAV1C1S0_OLDCO|nr:OLC1v1024102C1 [Oldenlandia corymbosa var. corymbosa]